MSEHPPTEILTPPERDHSAQPTAEQLKRKRRTIWLIVRLVLLVLLIALVLWGIVACVNAVTGAMQPTAASLVVAIAAASP